MFALFFLYLICGLFLVYADNEFLVPPPAGVDVLLGSSLTVQWRCDDCYPDPIHLDVWQAMSDSVSLKEKLLGTCHRNVYYCICVCY
jgi:hypothetical protein